MWLALARRWSRAFAVLFAVGADSGWDVLLDVWQNGGQVVVLGGAGYAAASARAAPGRVKSNDRRVAVLRRDLRRWMHDRDRQLEVKQKLIEAYARNPTSRVRSLTS